MSQFDSGQWLVCYDIREPKRLAKVFRLLKKHGVPMQYSVFLVDASAADMRRILLNLGKLIDVRADDIRAYGLPSKPQYDTIGKSMLTLESLPNFLLK